MYVWCIHMGMGAHVCLGVCGDWSYQASSLITLLLYSLRQGLFQSNPELTSMSSLGSQLAPGIPQSPFPSCHSRQAATPTWHWLGIQESNWFFCLRGTSCNYWAVSSALSWPLFLTSIFAAVFYRLSTVYLLTCPISDKKLSFFIFSHVYYMPYPVWLREAFSLC